MKKSQYILGAIVASLVTGATITNLQTFAATANSATITATPSAAEITSALDSIKSLPGYSTYAPMNNAEREQATPLFREYRYLAELVKTAEAMVNDYVNQTPEDLAMILQAAKDGYRGCSLIFANANTSASQPTTRAISNPTENTTSSSATATISLAEGAELANETSEVSPVSTEPTTSTESETIPESESDSAQDITTQDSSTDNLPLTLARTTTAFTAFGALATTNQKYFRKNRITRH